MKGVVFLGDRKLGCSATVAFGDKADIQLFGFSEGF